MSVIGNALITRPVISYGGISVFLAAAALSPTPTPLPLIGLISILRLASRQLAKRPGGVSCLFVILLAVAAGGSARHLAPALSATSSPLTSILSLYALNLGSSAIAFITLYLDARFSSRISNTGSQTLFFPALWTATWAIASLSPVGRLFAWSPVAQDMGPFEWLTPYLGPVGFDWIIAAGAVVLSEAVGTVLMGSPMVFEEEDVQCSEDLIISTDLINDPATAQNGASSRVAVSGRTVRYSAPFRRSMWALSVILVLLALPSYVVDDIPLSPTSIENLQITVGCVLPGPVDGRPPQLDHYINASMTLVESKILIWPEGAVHFKSKQDREDQISQIRDRIFQSKANAWVGISFEENIPLEASEGRYKTRNGFLLMNKTSIDHIYYKRNLVPIAESFKMIAGTEPPSLTHLNITEKRNHKHWRFAPLTLTAGICMDFASAGPFSGLSDRPGLVLAPARTWHSAAGRAMWSQAQSRAREIGASALLWCDGGEGGLSGVAGASVGPNGRLMRAGPGSWQADVTIPKVPTQATVYARWGDIGLLQLVWALVGLGALLESGRMAALSRGLPGLPRQLGRLIAYVQAKRHAATQRLQGERAPLLIDV